MTSLGKRAAVLSLEELESVSEILARELAFEVDAPVSIQVIGGRTVSSSATHEDAGAARQLEIVMSADAISGIRTREAAYNVFRGIAIHDLCHLLWPAVPQYKTAFVEGFKHLFNLLDDEQNDRLAQAAHPAWSPYLQSAVGHVLRGSIRRQKVLPAGFSYGDRQRQRPARGLCETSEYIARFNAFAYYFRRQVVETGPIDDCVAEALALVPLRFKDLTKTELLDLSRLVQQVLLRGIELPAEALTLTVQDDDGEPEVLTVEETVDKTAEIAQPEDVFLATEEGVLVEESFDFTLALDVQLPQDQTLLAEVPVDQGPDLLALDAEELAMLEGTKEEEDEPEDLKGHWQPIHLLTNKWLAGFLLAAVSVFAFLIVNNTGVGLWFKIGASASIVLVAGSGLLFLARKSLKQFASHVKQSGGGKRGVKAVLRRKREKPLLTKGVLAAAGAIAVVVVLALAGLIVLHAGLMVLIGIAFLAGLVYASKVRKRAKGNCNNAGDNWAKLLLPFINLALFGVLVWHIGLAHVGLIFLIPVMAIGTPLIIGGFCLLMFVAIPEEGSGTTGGTGITATSKSWDPSKFWPLVFKLIKKGFKALGKALKKLGKGIKTAVVYSACKIGDFLCWLAPKLWTVILAIYSVLAWLAVRAARGIAYVAVNGGRMIAAGATAFGRKVMKVCREIKAYTTWMYWKSEPYLSRAWRQPVLRLVILAVPISAIAAMVYAMAYTAANFSWWMILIAAAVILLVVALAVFNRKRLIKFVVQEVFVPHPDLMQFVMRVPLDMTTAAFERIDNIVPVDAQPMDMTLVQLLGERLRPYFQQLGTVAMDRDNQEVGYDLADDAELAAIGEMAIFIDEEDSPKASVHIEVMVDCSDSQGSATMQLKSGEKFKLAQQFALALEYAAFGLKGVSAQFWGFTGDTIYDCGKAGEFRTTGLPGPEGGNNDAAALWHMAQSAADSNATLKILFLINDLMPADCSWLALHNLGRDVERGGMLPWQIALDNTSTPAIDKFLTDASGGIEEAVASLQKDLAGLASQI